ncbi:MAG: hypothetical protein GX591_18070 [Planctomycetes bacterium]|nr:hypothetical protein [Planctomycetota bacterium]
MIVPYRIIEQADLIVFEPRQGLTADDYRDTWNDVLANPLFRKGMRTLTILAEGSMTGVTREAIAEGGKHLFRILGKRGEGKTAFAAPSDFEYGMARMIQIIADGVVPFDVGVFRNLGEALEWLDVETEAMAG